MKKKILTLGAVVVLVSLLVILTGCGEKNENGEVKNVKKNSELSKAVKVGDYVDYKAQAGNTYTSTADKSGVDKEQVFEVTGDEKWRVLSVEEDGSVNLISEKGITTKFEKPYSLSGEKGYKNGIEEFNNISKIYATGNHAVSGRSMNLSDLINLIGIDKIASVYEKEKETDLSSYSGDEKMKQAYKLMNEEYGNSYTINGQTETVNSAFHISSSKDGFGIEDITEDENIINLLKTSNGEVGKYIWLADEIIEAIKAEEEK